MGRAMRSAIDIIKKSNKKKNKSNSSNSFLGLAFDTSTTSHDSVENKKD